MSDTGPTDSVRLGDRVNEIGAARKAPREQVIKIVDREEDVGAAPVELPPKDRARYLLAGRVLLALLGVIIVAAYLMIYGPESRRAEAAEFFSFAKAAVPPLVTLVLGFYFNSQNNGS